MTDDPQLEPRIESWKAIAFYLQRDVRTVRRWEVSEGLPIHRHHHLARSTVYAFASELDAWRAGRKPDTIEIAVPPSGRFRVAAVAAIALLTLTAAGHGISKAASNAHIPQGQTVRAIWTGPGVDAMGSPSLDGRYLSYTDWSTGDLAVRDFVDGNSRRLTNTGGWEQSGDFAEFSSLSPDGRQIAYAWFVDSGETRDARVCRCRYQLRVMDVTGPEAGKPRILMGLDSGAFWVRPAGWMPDGRSIVVARSLTPAVNELGIVNLADGAFRLIRSTGRRMADRVAISADGSRIAMVVASDADATSDIVLIDVASGQDTPLVTHPANDYAPVFTADGEQLLFISDRTGSGAIWRIDVSGDKAEPAFVSSVPDNWGLLGATRDGALYYFSGGSASNVFVAAIDHAAGSKPSSMAVERFTNGNDLPVFSPDGRQFAYYSRRGAALGRGRRALMIHTVATGHDREVPAAIEPFDGLSWFPDGGALLVATREMEKPGFAFHRVDVNTGESSLLVRSSEIPAGYGMTTRRPVVAPDGSAIFFADDPAGAEHKGAGATLLRRYDLRSQQLRDVARTSSPDVQITSFAISADGNHIAYWKSDGPGRENILEIMPASGGPPRELLKDRDMGASRFNGVAWTPDNRYVVFVRAGDQPRQSALWKVPVGGGPAEPMNIEVSGTLRFPNLSPDGSRVLFAVGGQTEPAIWTLENFITKQ